MLTEAEWIEKFRAARAGSYDEDVAQVLASHDRAQRAEIAGLRILVAEHERQRTQWRAEIERLRASAFSARVERNDVMRHVEKMMLRTEAAEARAEKADAERYDLYSELALAKARLGEIVELCGDGGDGTAFGCVESLVADLAEQTARAEKYLAAAGRLTDAMRTTGIVWKQEIWQAFQALEKLVKVPRRG